MSLTRSTAISTVVNAARDDTIFVSALGFISRDLFAHLSALNTEDRGFYFMGAMGSVVPFALGLSMARTYRVIALEGDGSLLMNLGALATFSRFRDRGLKIAILDNRVYESTGGQSSQGADLNVARVIASFPLNVVECLSSEDIRAAINDETVDCLVIPVRKTDPKPRIALAPLEIKQRFAMKLLQVAEKRQSYKGL